MSLARQFFREFRPLFRMLEEPLGRTGAIGPVYSRHSSSPFTLLSDPFFASANVPEVDLSEEGNAFVVEASVPGIKKENLDLKIGDSGQSLTIRGKTVFSNVKPSEEGNGQVQASATADTAVDASSTTTETQTPTSTASPSTPAEGSSERTLTKLPENESRALSTERTFTSTSSFSRTIWFPQRVDESGVSAKLVDGVLTIRVPKAEDKGSFRVNIE